jgi:amidase
LSEWANFRSAHSVSGWSGRGGQTRNPYALDRNPCGSSSGSGVAVSANLCAVAVGTETDGSVVCPSSLNGIVGIKPTLGLISGQGIIPIAHSQDTAGPMARTVHDAALLLGALATGAHAQPDYTRFLDPRGLAGARLGVARKFFGITAEVDRLMESSLAEMKLQGAEMVDPADLPSHGKYDASELEVMLYEFKADLNAYLERRGGPSGAALTLEKLIGFNEEHRPEEMPFFDQELFLRAQKKGPLSEAAYRKALAVNRRMARAEGIDAVIRKHRVDAIVAPTAGPAWLIDTVNGDHDTGGCSTPAAVAGYPHITVPAGFVRGLPVGISFFGPAWSEPVLLKLAYAFEQTVKARRPPKLLATIEA